MLKNILSLAKDLMNIPSETQNTEEVKRAVVLVRKELNGFFIQDYENHGYPSFVAHNQNQECNKFEIILNAHVDVVPGGEKQYQPFEKDGKLYGRGAYDMKAAAAVMTLVFKEVARKVTYPLALQIISDEEVYSRYSTQYQIEQGIRGNFVITGESNSNFVIKTQAKGALWLTLKTKGKTAHGAYPWLGDNATWKLIDILQKLHAAFPTPKDSSWVTTINLAKIETTNIAFNKVPDNATALIDVRYIPDDKEMVLEKIRKCIPTDVEIDVLTQTSPVYIADDNSYVQNLIKQTEIITQKRLSTGVTPATSDIRFFNEVGCLGVEFGPVGGNNHADNEWVDIKSLEKYYEILKNFLLSLNK